MLRAGERITREEGLYMYAYAVRWPDGRESEEPEFLLARAGEVEPGTHRFPGEPT